MVRLIHNYGSFHAKGAIIEAYRCEASGIPHQYPLDMQPSYKGTHELHKALCHSDVLK